MISVIVYGRNDDHGYNLHRRAALSINCIAHVLTDPDDEIVFVDYNTPPELPVFLEGIRDTLTEAAVDRLRVIRVPAELHARRFQDRTHLTAVEPVARNVAIRRSSAANRWILSTNTDMVLVPEDRRSLSDVVANLPDAYWAIPRFQLPEALWERLDRRAPETALSTIGEWGTRLRLDEPITSYDWMAFDAPGDFQLVPRAWLWELGGFDESMLRGWHVDSNLARRMALEHGPARDLSAHVRGYHCDHTRVPGVFHENTVVNDVERYVFDVSRSDVPGQADAWGLADVCLEEVDLSATAASRLPETLHTVLGEPTTPLPSVDARDGPGLLSYPADHVLPYVASALSVLPRDAVIAYVGANPDLAVRITAVLADLGFGEPVRLLATGAGFEPVPGGMVVVPQIEVARGADAVVVDLGLPIARATSTGPRHLGDWTMEDRRALDRSLKVLDDLTRLDASDAPGARPLRAFVVVNAVYNAMEGAVDARLTGGSSQFATRVRHGRARPRDARVPALPRLSTGPVSSGDVGRYELGSMIDLTRSDSARALRGSWGVLTERGAWVDGREAGFALEVDPSDLAAAEAIFSVRIDRACDPRGRESRLIEVAVAGERLASWQFTGADADPALQRVSVPAELVRRRTPVTIELVVHELVPAAAATLAGHADPGVLVAGARLEAADADLRLGYRVELCGPDIPDALLWSGWSWPEVNGTWSIGATSVLRVPPITCPTLSDVLDVHLELAEVFVPPGPDPFEIAVLVDGVMHETWSFDHGGAQERHLELPVRDVATFVTLCQPAATSCALLGESPDLRRLGCKIAAYTLTAG